MTDDKSNSIKTWLYDDRPREKLLKKGASSLSNAELIAIIIGSGSTKKSAVDLARDILKSCNNNINTLSSKSIDDLLKFSGIGEAKAVSIIAALELSTRRSQDDLDIKNQILSSQNIVSYFRPIFANCNHEEFYVVYLNNQNFLLDYDKIAQGALTCCVVDIKIIIKKALDKYAQGLILLHNHPSGLSQPSEEDIKLTNEIKSAASFFKIKLLDHIIISNTNFYSFHEHNENFAHFDQAQCKR